MQFRIVGVDQHRAVVGPNTYICVRRDKTIESGVFPRWVACRNNTVLKEDCRTLNEAKNICRQALAEEAIVRP